MLLFYIYRVYRLTAFYLAIVGVFLAVSFASADQVERATNSKNKQSKDKTFKQDLLTTSGGRQDLLTAPKKQKSSNKASAKKADNKATASAKTPKAGQSGKTLKPDRNIDVYIGKCPYTVEGVKEAKKFLAQRKEYYGQFFMMKTESDYEVKPSDLAGIEVYLPLDAGKYEITNVPAFIINVGGHMYKISGTVDLEEVYREIVTAKAKGESKGGYTDLGVRGKACKAIIVNLVPKKTLNEQEKRAVIRDAGRPPNFTALLHQRKIVLPESSSPSVSEKQVGAVSPHGIPKYIVFSAAQKKWALEMSKSGAMGCCTDCTEIGDISHFAQLCTRELLTEFNVKSTPAVVNLK